MENEIQPGLDGDFQLELDKLEACGNLRVLPETCSEGKWIEAGGRRMLNLSSNDYLGLASDKALREEFLRTVKERDLCFSSSSSRLLTGNFPAYRELESLLASLFGAESALVFSSGYHMNTGILPAVTDANTLILADKLVHASLIDGIRLSAAKCIRYRHQDYAQLENLLAKHHGEYHRIIVVTESVFSMDGDVASLDRLGELKRRYTNGMPARAGGSRGTRLPEGHRFLVRYLRQGNGFRGSVCSVPEGDTRLPGEPDAYVDFHHGLAAYQCGMDALCLVAPGRYAGTAGASGQNLSKPADGYP